MIDRLKFRTIQVFRNHSLPRWVVLIIDLIAVFLTFLFSYMLRYNLEPYTFNLVLAIEQGFAVCIIYLGFMLIFKSYSGLIRQTTTKDTFTIAVTNTAALALLMCITISCRRFGWNSFFNISMSILMIHYVTVTVSLIFFRVFIKMFYVFVSIPSNNRKNVLIYGSGETGIIVKRVIHSDPRSGYQLKGFIDDDSKLQGKKVDGFPVYSKSVLSKEFIETEGIKVFIFAIKDISAIRKKEVLESLIDLGLEILDTPSFDQWLNGNLQVKQLRKVQFEDLLGREPIKLDQMRIGHGLKDKTILVTGAAGSIGSEIVRQLTKYSYKRMILIDQAETPVFYLNIELIEKYPDCRY